MTTHSARHTHQMMPFIFHVCALDGHCVWQQLVAHTHICLELRFLIRYIGYVCVYLSLRRNHFSCKVGGGGMEESFLFPSAKTIKMSDSFLNWPPTKCCTTRFHVLAIVNLCLHTACVCTMYIVHFDFKWLTVQSFATYNIISVKGNLRTMNLIFKSSSNYDRKRRKRLLRFSEEKNNLFCAVCDLLSCNARI